MSGAHPPRPSRGSRRASARSASPCGEPASRIPVACNRRRTTSGSPRTRASGCGRKTADPGLLRRRHARRHDLGAVHRSGSPAPRHRPRAVRRACDVLRAGRPSHRQAGDRARHARRALLSRGRLERASATRRAAASEIFRLSALTGSASSSIRFTSTCAPAARSDGLGVSLTLWLRPATEGTKIIAVGQSALHHLRVVARARGHAPRRGRARSA